MAAQIDEISLPEWKSAATLINNMKDYDVSDDDKKKIDLLDKYVQLRIGQATQIKTYIREKTTENDTLLRETNEKILGIIEQLKKL